MITLVLGGARSGKSEIAESLMPPPAAVTYLATAVVDPGDADFAARVAAHRARRPGSWQTVECGADLPRGLERAEGAALVDSLGTWVAATPGFAVDTAALCEVLARRRNADTVVVSEEVGLGVHPETEIGRTFRDVLGALNQAVAAVSDEVLLVVAGRVLRLDRAGAGR